MDMFNGLLLTVAFLAAAYFVGAQGVMCVEMPKEWFCSLVSGTIIALCWLARRR